MELLERLVVEAVDSYGGQEDGMFTSATFSGAIMREFKLAGCVDGGWCARVLGGLPYVVPMPHGCHWLYRPKRPIPFQYEDRPRASRVIPPELLAKLPR